MNRKRVKNTPAIVRDKTQTFLASMRRAKESVNTCEQEFKKQEEKLEELIKNDSENTEAIQDQKLDVQAAKMELEVELEMVETIKKATPVSLKNIKKAWSRKSINVPFL